jgi:hypothetical protein
MKKYFKILGGLLLAVPSMLMISSCEDFLDKKPLSATLDDLNQGSLEGQVYGLYSFVRTSWGFSSLSWIAMHSIRADEAEKGSDQSDGAEYVAIFDNFTYAKDLWAANTYWDDHYTLINQANTAIQIADSLKQTDATSLSNVGEARFFRAMSYFDLVRTYGEVPKIDFRVYNAAQAIKPKAPVEEIYKLIDEDLTFAAANLPTAWGAQYPGRITSGAAKTLLAKAYLFRKNWTKAHALSKEVVNSGTYSLYDSYFGIFKESGENSSESIFEIQAYVSADGVVNEGCQYATTQGVRQSTASGWNLGWGWNTPTEALVSAYEEGDPRKNATILFAGQSDDPSSGGYGRTLPRSTFDTPPGILFRKYYNKKVYADPARQAQANMRDQAPWINKRVLRYADVVLMVAESANELGNTGEAIEYLEMVRARARKGASSPNALPKITTNLRDAIKHERQVEFGMEGERFFDLVRWGDAIRVLGPLGYTHKNRYYPIPQPTIDKSNGVLIQNPEY